MIRLSFLGKNLIKALKISWNWQNEEIVFYPKQLSNIPIRRLLLCQQQLLVQPNRIEDRTHSKNQLLLLNHQLFQPSIGEVIFFKVMIKAFKNELRLITYAKLSRAVWVPVFANFSSMWSPRFASVAAAVSIPASIDVPSYACFVIPVRPTEPDFLKTCNLE